MVQELPSSVQVMDSTALHLLNGISIADKLKHSAGLNVRTYGGTGALQSISVRGMGSDYSLILVNGVRFTTFQIGTVDLGIFSAQDVERVEIANGGSSALYGADAVGGVINIITKQPSARFFASAAHTAGSFGLSGTELTAGGGDDGLFLRGSLGMRRAANRFGFTLNDGSGTTSLKRTGADFVTRNASISIQRLFSDEIISTVMLRYGGADRGQPAAVTGPVQANSARINDKDIFLNSVTVISFERTDHLTVPVSYHFNRQTYSDPSVVTGGIPLDAYYENSVFSTGPVYHVQITAGHTVTAGAELAAARIYSNELRPSRREQYSSFISTEHRFHSPVELILFPSVRYDAFSDIDGGISSKIGMNAGIMKEPVLRLRGSIGRNYRVPTFNDLYWLDGGNPDLTPEQSVSGDAGLIAGTQNEYFSADLDVGIFRIDANNKIVWRPAQNARWSPVNVQSVSSTGFELSAAVNVLDNMLAVRYHHTRLRAVKTSADGPNDATVNKFLPYVPKETATISVSTAAMGFTAGVLYSFTGFRFETADNDPRYILPTIETVDANLSYTIVTSTVSMTVRGEVNNLTDQNYQMITGYPLPMRNYAVTTTLSL
jgi:iron complex outermembrane receptor protein